MTDLGTSLGRALGDRSGKALAAGLDLHTVGDLLHHYPHRYAERGRLTALTDLEVGEHVTVMAEVKRSAVRTARSGKPLAEVVITDGRGSLTLTFFGRTAHWHVGRLPAGTHGLFSGQVSRFGKGVGAVLQLTHPDYLLAAGEGEGAELAGYAGALIPVYPACAAFPSWNVAKAVATVLDAVDLGPEPLPEVLLAEHGLPDLRTALEAVHRPATREDVELATRRLTWDEAMVLQVVLAQRRRQAGQERGTPRPGRPDGLLAAFDAQTPFTLTGGQRDIGAVLAEELARPHPMHRLLQGEVGSGKTLIALRAMLAVLDSGGQAALLAPTEVLAQQHARSLRSVLGPLARAGELDAPDVATSVALLTGSLGAAARRTAREDITAGRAGIVVGTHALLSDGIDFADLGLVVVDEQHRFGVEQREALRAKGAAPHLLVMTATPIPRTVAMTVYGDLEVSTLAELPRGRSPIRSYVVPLGEQPGWIERAWQRIHEAAGAGRQSFIVCPRVGDAEDPAGPDEQGRRPAAAVEEVIPALAGGPLRGLRVAALHGRMATEDKEAAMRAFVAGDTEVLVATTVVEVGVDVPNATVMVVLDADRFGVSQLHQLRGRIGRGQHPGLCLLVTEAPVGSPARERIDAVAGTTDGFELSRIDLEQRREGDVLGRRQSGRRSSLRMLRLLRDEDVIAAAREAATELVDDDPELVRHPGLAAAVDSVLDPGRADFLEKT